MYIVIFITARNRIEAKKISSLLIKNKLAACVTIVKAIESFFWWKNKVDTAKEVLLIVKTKKDKFERIVRLVKSLHSYSVPEIIAMPIIGGSKEYLNWINESIG